MNPLISIFIEYGMPFVMSWINMARATSPLPPAGASAPPASVTAQHPSEAIKRLQTLLNQYVTSTKPLKVDGIYGPMTDAAVTAALKLFGLLG